MEFDEWMREVDVTIERNLGLSVDDLPDKNYRDWFDGGMSPGKAAYNAIKDELEDVGL